MNSKLLSISYKLALLLLLISLVLIYNYFTESKNTVANNNLVSSIDYYATDIKVVQYKEEDGGVDYKITASQMTHIQNTDIAYLTNPTADLYKNSQYPWLVSSNEGEIGPKGDIITLINNIKGTQVDDQGKMNTFEVGQQKNKQDPIKYGELVINTVEQTANSKDFALVTSPDGQNSGIGVEVFFKTNKIKFLSQVKTYLNQVKHATN